MSIYKELKARNQEIDNHNSDLYTPVNEVTKKLVENYEFKENVRTFYTTEHELYYEIPFAYDPYWESKKVEFKKEESNYRISQFNKIIIPTEQEEIPLIKIKIHVGSNFTNYLNINESELNEIQKILINNNE